jgi:hypothetical protein
MTVQRSLTRAPFRLLSIRAPRQAVLRTSSWLAPFEAPTGLATSRRERRAMHPTDFCHPNETTCARTSCVPGCSRRLRGGMPHGVLGSVRRDRGTGRFTTSRTASADRHRHVNLRASASRPWTRSVGVVFPRCGCDRASDTPVALSRSPSRLSRLRGSCMLTVIPNFWRGSTGRRVRKSAEATCERRA